MFVHPDISHKCKYKYKYQISGVSDNENSEVLISAIHIVTVERAADLDIGQFMRHVTGPDQ